MDPSQAFFGYKLAHIVAGFGGGLVRALVRGESVGASLVSIIVGMLTTVHLTPMAMEWLGRTSQSADLGIGFLIGVAGMFIAEGVMKYARTWLKNPTIPGGLK